MTDPDGSFSSTEPERRTRLTHPKPHAPAWKERRWTSRVIHRLDETVSHPISGLAAIGLVLAWLAVGAFAGFPSWWATSLFSVTGCVTFVMVFVLQHTQARQTSATQLKLDELIRASTRADDGLIAVQEAPDGLLDRLTESTVADRQWT